MSVAFDVSESFVTSSGGTTAGGSITLSSGANLILAATMGAGTIGTPTYDGVAGTLIMTHSYSGGNNFKVYKWETPATGTKTITVERVGTSYHMTLSVMAFKDANLLSFPDASIQYSDHPFLVNVNNLTTTLSSTEDDCLFALFAHQDNGAALTTGTSGVSKKSGGLAYPSCWMGAFCADAIKSSAGSQAINVSGESGHIFTWMVSIASGGGTPPANGNFFLVL